jgi:hypothetical protein
MATISRDEALLRLDRLGATASRPVVSAGTRTAILDSHAIADPEGRAPGTAGWVGTWDLNAAISEVWATKAAQVAGDFNFKADDAEYQKADVLAHMLAMRDQYAAMAVTTAGVSRMGAGTLTVGGTNAGLTNPLDAIAATVIP